MNELLILGGIVVGLWLALLLLRVPSSIAFLSLLIGQLLATEASSDVYEFVSSVTQVSKMQYVQIALLVLPLVLTVLFLHHRVSKAKLLIEAVPVLLLSALTVMLLAPLESSLNQTLEAATNDQADAYKTIIIIAASISGLLSAWLSYPKPVHKDDKHGKHK